MYTIVQYSILYEGYRIYVDTYWIILGYNTFVFDKSLSQLRSIVTKSIEVYKVLWWVALLPDGRKFGKTTQKGPQKYFLGRGILVAVRPELWPKVTEKGSENIF